MGIELFGLAHCLDNRSFSLGHDIEIKKIKDVAGGCECGGDFFHNQVVSSAGRCSMAEIDCRCLFVAFCLGVGGEEGERKEGTGIEETVMQWQTAKRNNYANW